MARRQRQVEEHLRCPSGTTAASTPRNLLVLKMRCEILKVVYITINATVHLFYISSMHSKYTSNSGVRNSFGFKIIQSSFTHFHFVSLLRQLRVLSIGRLPVTSSSSGQLHSDRAQRGGAMPQQAVQGKLGRTSTLNRSCARRGTRCRSGAAVQPTAQDKCKVAIK